jgi:16S rRNA (cytosine967-C5)-methyltransferase
VLRNTPFSAIADLRGKVFVQDEAAQVIGYLLDPREGNAILDACAAPGGKATHIAQITRNGSAITAVEEDEKRLKLLNDNIRSSGAHSVSAVRLDILDYRSVTPFDRILLDAPCSALGVIRRNPDVKYRHSPEALRKFGIKQLEILNHVSSLLKRGGTMVYSVCSTEPEETRDVIAGFLNNKKDFYIIDTILDVTLPEPFTRNLQELFNEEGFMITYPHVHHVDGFFAVRLGRK